MSNASKVQEMIAIMSRSGWRITDQRRTLAKIFTDTDGFLTPKEVYDLMKDKYSGVSFDTVYRNLRMLSEMGVLEQFYFMEGGLKFKGSCFNHHHHHFICMNCEKTYTFEYCPMSKQIHVPDNFKVMNHRFEIYGVCGDCQQLPEVEEADQ